MKKKTTKKALWRTNAYFITLGAGNFETISYFRLRKACDLVLVKSVSVGCRRYINTKGLGNYITEHGGGFVVDERYISGLHAAG